MKELLNANDVDMNESDVDFDTTNKSIEVIQKAMENVIAEVIILLDGQSHLVYITKFEMDFQGKIEYDFAIIDETKRNELIPHIDNMFQNMLKQAQEECDKNPWVAQKSKWKIW